MILIRRLTPTGLKRAIVTLATRTGNKLMHRKSSHVPVPHQSEKSNSRINASGRVQVTERTTITVETERLLIVRSERNSST